VLDYDNAFYLTDVPRFILFIGLWRDHASTNQRLAKDTIAPES